MENKILRKTGCFLCTNDAYFYEDDRDGYEAPLCSRCQEAERLMMEEMYPSEKPVVGALLQQILSPRIKEVTGGPSHDPYGGTQIKFKILGVEVYICTLMVYHVIVSFHNRSWTFNMVENAKRDYLWPDRLLRYNSAGDLLIGGAAKWVFDNLVDFNGWKQSLSEEPNLRYWE